MKISTPILIINVILIFAFGILIGGSWGFRDGKRHARPVEAFKEEIHLKDGRWFPVIYIKQGSGKTLHFFFEDTKYVPNKRLARKYARELKMKKEEYESQ